MLRAPGSSKWGSPFRELTHGCAIHSQRFEVAGVLWQLNFIFQPLQHLAGREVIRACSAVCSSICRAGALRLLAVVIAVADGPVLKKQSSS
jgi:hypothetical protein